MVKTKKRYSKISTYGQAAVGTFFMALAVRWIYEPQSMVTGGFSGIGIVLNRILPIPVSVTTLVLNIPLFLYSWKKKGFSFLGKSLWGMMCFSLFLAVLPLGTPGDDRLLAALLGGGISGVGLGLVIRAGGSTGGTDLLGSLFCGGKLGWSVSTVIGVLDGVIVLWGTVLAAVNFFVPTEWFWIVYMIQLINISGAAGDLFAAVKFTRMPKNILIQDSGVSMRVFYIGN